jgi:hypothetical protein
MLEIVSCLENLPNPLPDLSNSHHNPIDMAAKVRDNCMLLAKSNF